ncbi:chemotaxis protein [Fulvivirga sp. RKSG066]|uniref:chemotaxis protein n=1 Tax=Fulvivirga aurantia TaxID=2529383 RepID=UPI0012BD66DD|nr:chemotaxis protein [Fulvivirga aurantia]MTI20231.1 chemotaxis protein [Fulvivirga aurantia]
MDFINKVKWITGIVLVFIIVLTTNLIDKDNFNRLRQSVITIYEDRIVANDLIFEMTILMQKKEMAIAVNDSAFFKNENIEVNQAWEALIERYEQTKLTNKEQRLFNELKEQKTELLALESEYVASDFSSSNSTIGKINSIVNNLSGLSKVQLDEGKRQMEISNETMKTIDLFTQVEILFLVVMAILIQIIILYKPKD